MPNSLLEQLKEHFENTPRDVLEKEWKELSVYNEIGPTVEEYMGDLKDYYKSLVDVDPSEENIKHYNCLSKICENYE